MTYLCHISQQPPGVEWPDAGEGICCDGAAEYGPSGCLCWEPIYDLDQVAELDEEGPGLRASPCDDCAYRGGSPERRGEEHVSGTPALLGAIVEANQPFFCHQGIRRIVGFRHPSGVTLTPDIPLLEAAYRPPIEHGIPHRADGRPADLCAGWAAARLGQGARS